MDSDNFSDPQSIANEFAPAAMSVNVAIFAICDDQFSILLNERDQGPFRFQWELPSSFVLPDESLFEAASRVLGQHATEADTTLLQQLGAYATPRRDPRMRSITVAYTSVLSGIDNSPVDSTVASSEFVPITEVLSGSKNLAFDHGRITTDSIARIRLEIGSTTLAAKFCPPEFTIAQLRNVYEKIWETAIEAGNFQRKTQQVPNFLVPLAKKAPNVSGAGRPPKLFTSGAPVEIYPPLKRKLTILPH